MRIFFLLLVGVLFNNTLLAESFKGRLEWVNKIDMRVLESGIVDTVTIKPGDRIKKNQLLLRMDQRATKAKLLQSNARVARAELALADTERDLQRTQELFDRGLIAEEELKDSELSLSISKADLETAKAFRAAAKVEHDRTEIKAPFNGIVVTRDVDQGDVIYKTLQQTPLISVAETHHMLARILVTAKVVQRYKKGQTADLSLRGKRFTGKIYSLGVEPVRIDMEGAVYELDIIFDTPANELLRPSERVIVTLQ